MTGQKLHGSAAAPVRSERRSPTVGLTGQDAARWGGGGGAIDGRKKAHRGY